MESEFWLAASRNVPVGSMAKFRGVLPRVERWPAAVSYPVCGSTAKIAMLSWPRFEA